MSNPIFVLHTFTFLLIYFLVETCLVSWLTTKLVEEKSINEMNSVEISGLIPKLGLVVVGIVLVECTRQGLNYLQRKNSKPVIRQVIFFPDKRIACKDFFDSVEGCSRIRCDFSHTTTGFRLDIYEFFVCRSMTVEDNLYFITFCNAGNYFPT